MSVDFKKTVLIIGAPMRKHGGVRQRWDVLDKYCATDTADLTDKVLSGALFPPVINNVLEFLEKHGVIAIVINDNYGWALAYIVELPSPIGSLEQSFVKYQQEFLDLMRSSGIKNGGYVIILRSHNKSLWLENLAHEIGHLYLKLIIGNIGSSINYHHENFAEEFGRRLSLKSDFRFQARKILYQVLKAPHGILKLSSVER